MTRRMPAVDAGKSKIVDDKIKLEERNPLALSDNGGLSIDDLIVKGLNQIRALLIVTGRDINLGAPTRETVMTLKDCMTMLHELKKKEKELLESLSDEDLERITNVDEQSS